eukprot:CAMPEP_0202729208 /NCGR_PEP_ID=MMETSP1385-20130828/186015_1 /ASSEMBLY_ACC=CAM_ASM_000861 /TAXON_ID=933848 /ORGANISM="Elphidium margaritaceum" /LENGTH=593 /DNA_ID=CAMNT_0049395465 /DNA_START=81 /DNA_END=1862 /DNA_ORIENTATION=-
MKRVRHDNHYQIAQHCAKKHKPNACVPQITNALCRSTTFKYESHPTQPNTAVISLVSDDENDDPPLLRPPPLNVHAIKLNLPPSRAAIAAAVTANCPVVLPPPTVLTHNLALNGRTNCNGHNGHHTNHNHQQHPHHHLMQYAQIASSASSSSQSAASKGSAASDASSSSSSASSSSSSSSSASASSEDTNKESSSSLYSVDSNGYLVFRAGLVMLDRYKLVRALGKGTFSRVFECNEIVPHPTTTTRRSTRRGESTSSSATSRYKRTGRKFAIKVVRNVHKYRLAARIELRILQRIREHDANNASNCIHLVEHAEYRQHPLLIFPLYGRSVYSFMVEHGYKPFSLDDIVHIMHQILVGVDYVHSLNIIITDLKPENIVLVRDDVRPTNNGAQTTKYLAPQSTQIKLIDFGSAVVHEHGARHTHLIQTRHYRAPEVVFKLAWSFSADIWSVGCMLVELVFGKMLFNTHCNIDWSVGCMLVELVFGKMLFNTHCNIDHINQMVKCIGSPPRFLLESIDDDTWDELFDANGNLNTFKAKISKIQCKALWEYFVSTERNPLCHQLYELCTHLLTWSPSVRWTARDALQHPVFRRYYS